MNNKKNGLYLTAFLLCLNLSTEAHGVASDKTDAMRESSMTALRQRDGNVVSMGQS